MIAHLFSLSWATRWNLALAVPIVTTTLLAERFGGVSWAFIAAVYGGAVGLGLVVVAVIAPAVRRSYQWAPAPTRLPVRPAPVAVEAGERAA